MQQIVSLIFRIIRKLLNIFKFKLHYFVTRIILYCNNVRFQQIYNKGIPIVRIARGGNCTIGSNFKMNNNFSGNLIGRVQPCMLVVSQGASLLIGNNVGISSTAIVAHHYIQIGNDVKIGGGVCIYDTDFHSINPEFRKDRRLDSQMAKSKSVIIGDNVFIGAHSTILKGVIIGENSVIGACSVISKNVPPNEIWAGNPARFVKKLE